MVEGYKPVPIQYRKSPANILSYNYEDVASGLGVSTFYLFNTTNSTATTYHLTDQVIYSADIAQKITASTTSDTDYDLTTFNHPRTTEGTGIIQLSVGAQTTAGVTSFYVVLTLRKVSGGVETDLVSVTSPTLTTAANPTSSALNFCMEMTIPKTLFKIGDTLRLNVAGTTNAGGVGYIGIDPKSRSKGIGHTVTMTITDSNIQVPFKLEV